MDIYIGYVPKKVESSHKTAISTIFKTFTACFRTSIGTAKMLVAVGYVGGGGGGGCVQSETLL